MGGEKELGPKAQEMKGLRQNNPPEMIIWINISEPALINH